MAVASHSSIIPYLPGALAEWSRSGEVALPLPSLENFEGAFLVIDASGFTRVASRLSRQGGVGVERISEVLTDFFTNLGALVETEGGVVFGFEGDALLAGWRCDGDPLPSSLLRCCGCALAIRGRLKDWRVDDQTLQMRMSIGAGTIQLLHLGHETRRCCLLPAGEAVEQATALVPRTDANEILVSSQAWPLIQTYCEADPHGDGVMRLIRVNANLARAAPREFSDVPLRDLSSYLPRALRTGLRSSLPEWGGELRIVTVAFIKASLTEKKPSSLMDLNCALLSIEHITDDYGGELLEVAKGTDGLDALQRIVESWREHRSRIFQTAFPSRFEPVAGQERVA